MQDRIPNAIEALHRRIGSLDRQQIAAWRQMSHGRRLHIACQAYQFALNVVRTCEQKKHPYASPDEFAWHVTRRMQGQPRLGL